MNILKTKLSLFLCVGAIALVNGIYSPSLFAQHKVKMKTDLPVGTKINRDDFWVNEDSGKAVTIVGLKKISNNKHEITDQNIEISGEILELNCGSIKLTSLNVTEAPELTDLDCRNNNIPSLDLSKNTKLKYLACGGNLLTSLSLLENSKLRFLNCSRSKSLKTVDLSKLNILRSLYIHDCEALEGLDLSNNEGLEVLYGFKSNLKSLDLSSNIKLEELHVYNNNLSKLDLSGNEFLASLSCHDNQLTSLKVSKEASFRGIEIYHNKLDRTALFEFIQSLPVNSNLPLNLYVVNSASGVEEGNVCTKLLVDMAKKKGFVMYDFNGSVVKEYPGIENFPHFTFSTDLEVGAIIPAFSVEGKDIVLYEGIEKMEDGKFKVLSSDVLLEGDVTKFVVQKAKVNKLDVKNISSLSSIDCSDNSLTSLDLTHNKSLQEIRCAGNQLKKLEISSEAPLNLIYCHNNDLKGGEASLLVQSLPNYKNVTLDKEAKLCIVQSNGEKNDFSDNDVALAKEKNWIVYKFNGSDYEIYNSIEELVGLGLKIAFDAEKKELSIDNLTERTEISILSVSGAKIYNQWVDSPFVQLNLNHLPSGVYLLCIGKQAVKIAL